MRKVAMVAVMVICALQFTPVSLAQNSTSVVPISSTVAALDLAAMALDSTEIPEGFTLSSELYMPGSRLSEMYTGELVSQDKIDATGLLWFYESRYQNADGSVLIRSYIEQYQNNDGATAGFAVLEDETVLAAIGGTNTDEPGMGVGQEPSEVSNTTILREGMEVPLKSLDATFRTGSILSGVAVETTDGSTPDRALATELVNALGARIEGVLAGAAPPAVDLALANQVMRFDPEWLPGEEGYISAVEAFGEIGGAEIGPSYFSGYLRSVGAGSPFPVISIHIEHFTDEGAALQVLNEPGVYQPAYAMIEPFDPELVDGASVVVGYYYANPQTGSTIVDSARLVMVVGSSMVTIDTRGSIDKETAAALAQVLATKQVDCLHSSDVCEMPEIAASLLEAPEPVATPAPEASPTPISF